MPGGFPLGLEVCNGTSIAPDTANSRGTTVNSNALANTLGAWTQLIASTASDCVFLNVGAGGFVFAGSDGALDIGVGAAGSEQVIAGQLHVSMKDAAGDAQTTYPLPLAIPAGTRIAARCQVTHANDGLYINLQAFDGAFTNFDGYSGIDSFGFVSATTIGTQVDPGAVLNTKGAYTQLVASTAKDYAGFFFAFDLLNQQTGNATDIYALLVDFAIGAAGSEKIIIPDFPIRKIYLSAPYLVVEPGVTPIFWVPVPSGTKISARCQADNATSPNRLIGITGYGIYQ